MILLIDNYDSFTYNLAQIIEKYEPIEIVRNDDPEIFEAAEEAKGIVISPGPGKPSETGFVYEVVRQFYQQKPILGICLGHQALGEIFGSRVALAKRVRHGKRSDISCLNQGIFKGLDEKLTVMRYHSLVVPKEGLSPDLMATATATDDGEIMAFEHKAFPIYGIQFHPESIGTPDGEAMIRNFIQRVEGKADGKAISESV